MKKAWLCAVISAVVLSAFSAGYKKEYYEELLTHHYESADKILKQWMAADSTDAELYPARFNALLNSAHITVELSADTVREGDYFVFSDSTGRAVGSIGGCDTWIDSLYFAGINVIDEGIERHPDRLDFRFGKAAACKMRDFRQEVADVVSGVLKRSKENNFGWLWEDNMLLGDSARQRVFDGAYDYLLYIAETEDSSIDELAGSLAQNILEVFPDDYRVLNILGATWFNRGDYEKALSYFMKASEKRPDDGLIALNIAYTYSVVGDKDAAIAKYREIEANENFDEEARQFANSSIAKLVNPEPLNEMRPYDYFFAYLPQVASGVPVGQQMAEEVLGKPEVINTDLVGRFGFRSPFANDEIHIDVVTRDEKTVYVWTFPDPERTPLCKYVAFIPQDGTYVTRTFEKMFEPEYWMIGTSSGNGRHTSFMPVAFIESGEAFGNALFELNMFDGEAVKNPMSGFNPGNGKQKSEATE